MSWTPPPTPGTPPPYGYGGYAQPPDHPQGTTILVLGILSLVFCQILGPFAWSMGSKALKEIDASGVPCGNRGSVQAGRICGIVASVLLILSLLAVVAVILLAMVGTTAETRFEPVGETIGAFISVAGV